MNIFYYYKAFFLTAVLILTVSAATQTISAAPGNDNLANALTVNFDGFTTATIVDTTNVGATREAGEMVHYNQSYPGEKTVWYKWTATAHSSVQIEVSSPLFNSLMRVYKSAAPNPTFQDLSGVVDNLSVFNFYPEKNVVRFRASAGTTYYIAVGADNLNQATTEGLFTIQFSLNKLRYSSNFGVRTGDKMSMAVYRPSEGVWYSMSELSAAQPNYYRFGLSGAQTPDQPIPADFDGDSLTDLAVTRNQGGFKYWYIKNRFNSFLDATVQWGLATDKALTGDFDRDGRADLVAIRNNGQNLVWYVLQSKQNDYRVFVFGLSGDNPVIGDFDGDGATDVAVTRLTNGSLTWHILKSGFYTNPNATYTEYAAAQFGVGNDAPVTEDFDGDGKTDLAVFRHVTGSWLILRSTTNQVQETQFGQFLDKPQPADFDGDGRADLVLFRPSEGRWYFWFSGSNTQTTRNWGVASDIPVSSMNTLTQ